MAVLNVALMGHPVLSRPALPVEDPTRPEIAQLIDDMLDTMDAESGVGLAAPQVAVGLRIIVFKVPGDRSGEADIPPQALINPEITPLSDDTAEAYEACLSVPGLTGPVPRWTRIRYRGLRPDGTVVEREATGYHARVIQHECDHLDGRLYLSRMQDIRKLAYLDEIRRQIAAKDAVKDKETP